MDRGFIKYVIKIDIFAVTLWSTPLDSTYGLTLYRVRNQNQYMVCDFINYNVL
jgi:hypothetical protein